MLRIAQVCADRGVAPGGTKGASQHLRGIAAGLTTAGQHVETFTYREAEGPFPVTVRALEDLESCVGFDVVYERYSLGHLGGLRAASRLGVPFVLEVNAPLVDEAIRHRPETVTVEHREVELELLRTADLVITVASELSRWGSDRRTGPVLTQPNGFETSPDATIYIDRKLGEGKTRREARRAHKRHLANRVIRRMWKDESSRREQPINIAA